MRFACVLFWLCCGAAPAQSVSYSKLPQGSIAPAPRFDGALAYDRAGHLLYLFGGQNASAYNDLWQYSLDNQSWSQIPTPAPAPPPRFGHTLLFDSNRRRLILFAGQAGVFYSDVWAFDIAAATWTQLSPDNAGPARRYGHGAIYETARDRMIITHGFTHQGRFDDTWAFDLTTNRWKDISPVTRPLKRCLFHAAYDQARGQMFIFGGCASGFGPCPLDDLWAFDLAANTWSQKTSSPSPPARDHYGLAFDSNRGRLIVFEGLGADLLDDNWEFDAVSQSWAQPAVTGTRAPARQRMETVYVPEDNAAYFFGGQTASGVTNELWRLGAAPLSPPTAAVTAVMNAFSFAGGAAAPGELVSIFGTNLGPPAGIVSALDNGTGKLPTKAAGVSLTFNGFAAPLYYVRQDQINAQVPYEVAGAQQLLVQALTASGASAPLTIPLLTTHPGLANLVFNQDATLNSAANPAATGSIIVLFATGQGVTSPESITGASPHDAYPVPAAPVRVTVGGIPATVLFDGQAPSTVGVMQINARLPDGLVGPAQPIVLHIGDGATQQMLNLYLR